MDCARSPTGGTRTRAWFACLAFSRLGRLSPCGLSQDSLPSLDPVTLPWSVPSSWWTVSRLESLRARPVADTCNSVWIIVIFFYILRSACDHPLLCEIWFLVYAKAYSKYTYLLELQLRPLSNCPSMHITRPCRAQHDISAPGYLIVPPPPISAGQAAAPPQQES